MLYRSATAIRTIGCPARSSAATPLSCAALRLPRQPHVDEHAVLTVDLWRPERLGIDWHEPLAQLSGRLREKLLEPGAEIGDPR